MHIRSRLLRVEKHRTLMATCASQTNESRLVSRSGISPVSVRVGLSQERAHNDSPKSSSGVVFHPSVEITPGESVQRTRAGWRAWFAESVHVAIGSKIQFRYQGPKHLLVLYNAGSRKNGETSIDGLDSSRLRSFVHKLTFVPAGRVYREWHETSMPTRVTFLYLAPDALQKSDASEVTFLPRIYFEDSLVWETARKLQSTIESGEAKCVPYMEALSGLLAHELSGANQEVVRVPAGMSRGGLASWQERVVIDYIEKHLGERVCVRKLAELARLSLHHFCRAFKQSFGIPAYQYQVRRRMEVAKLLLTDRATSVTEIALSLGYAQTGSFSNAFRKTTGWTPRAYRRQFKRVDKTVHLHRPHWWMHSCSRSRAEE